MVQKQGRFAVGDTVMLYCLLYQVLRLVNVIPKLQVGKPIGYVPATLPPSYYQFIVRTGLVRQTGRASANAGI